MQKAGLVLSILAHGQSLPAIQVVFCLSGTVCRYILLSARLFTFWWPAPFAVIYIFQFLFAGGGRGRKSFIFFLIVLKFNGN